MYHKGKIQSACMTNHRSILACNQSLFSVINQRTDAESAKAQIIITLQIIINSYK